MKKHYRFLLFFALLPLCTMAQSDQHYTMFMYNKLLYNPAYAGSRDAISLNALYRNQWGNIDGAPRVLNASIDATTGSYMKPFRNVAMGFNVNNEQLGVESNTNMKLYYAYRIKLKSSVLSFGLSGGINLYSAAYNRLFLYQQNDPNFSYNIRNAVLPNFGAGVYWAADNYYCGFSVPNMLEDYYDKNEVKRNNKIARQIRGYYLNGGYVYKLNETVMLVPQLLARYVVNSDYRLPVSCDFTLAGIIYERFMVGVSYRTDKSFEGIVHVQATKRLNVGYAYDYLISDLMGYSGSTHELVVGYDILRPTTKYATPRFIKKF